MVQPGSGGGSVESRLDEFILQVFEEAADDDQIFFPLTSQKTARGFVKAVHAKGYAYEDMCGCIDEIEHNFSAWRKGLGRVGIGKRMLARLNRPLQDLLDSDDEDGEELSARLAAINTKRAAATGSSTPARRQDLRERLSVDPPTNGSAANGRSNGTSSGTSSGSSREASRDTSRDTSRETSKEKEIQEERLPERVVELRHTEREERRAAPCKEKLESQAVFERITGKKKSEDEADGKEKEAENKSKEIEKEEKQEKPSEPTGNSEKTETREERLAKLQERIAQLKRKFPKDGEDSDGGKEAERKGSTSSSSSSGSRRASETPPPARKMSNPQVEEAKASPAVSRSSSISDPPPQNTPDDEQEEEEAEQEEQEPVQEEPEPVQEEPEPVQEETQEVTQEEEQEEEEQEEEEQEAETKEEVEAIEEGYDSDLDAHEESPEDLQELVKRIRALKVRHSDGPGYLYVFSDSDTEATEQRVKISASRYPTARLEQARLFNLDLQSCWTGSVSKRLAAASEARARLEQYQEEGTLDWFRGPINTILDTIMAVADEFSDDASLC